MFLTSVSLSCGRFVFQFSEVEFVPRAPEFRQVIPITKCRRSTLHWATGAALWTLRPRKAIMLSEATLGKCKHLLSLVGLRPPSEPRARAFPLHPAQALSPCTRPTGAALWIPGKGLSLAFCAGAPPCTRPHKKRYRFDTAICVVSLS